MSYGEISKTDWQNIITVRPGPVLHVWRNGGEFCAVPLDHNAALTLIGSLTAAMQVARPTIDAIRQADEPPMTRRAE